MKKSLIIVSILMLVFAFINCTKSGDASPTAPAATATNTPAPGTISGTLSGLPVPSTGLYIVFVDNDLNEANGYITHTFSSYGGGGTQAYSVTVTGGTYYVYALHDLNTSSYPDVGEYLGVYGATYPAYPLSANVSVDGGIATTNITMAAATANVTGTITLPASVTSKTGYIITDLDGDGATSDDFITYDSGPITGNTIPYSLVVPFPNVPFYIYGYVDNDGSGDSGPNTGDYAGIYISQANQVSVTITNLGTANGPYSFTAEIY